MIVGHDDPFEAATGIYPEPQGVRLRREADPARRREGFEVVARVPSGRWAELAAEVAGGE